MTPRPDLNILAKEVHEANKLKGFHEKEWSNEHLLCLVISKIMKAVDAGGKRAQTRRFISRIETSRAYKGLISEISPERAYKVIYNETIKGSIEERLADAVIRLLGIAGLRDWDIVNAVSMDVYVLDYPNMSFTEIIDDIVSARYSTGSINNVPSVMIKLIEGLCKHLNIDLWLHVELKMKYNQTRPPRHGKSY